MLARCHPCILGSWESTEWNIISRTLDLSEKFHIWGPVIWFPRDQVSCSLYFSGSLICFAANSFLMEGPCCSFWAGLLFSVQRIKGTGFVTHWAEFIQHTSFTTCPFNSITCEVSNFQYSVQILEHYSHDIALKPYCMSWSSKIMKAFAVGPVFVFADSSWFLRARVCNFGKWA